MHSLNVYFVYSLLAIITSINSSITNNNNKPITRDNICVSNYKDLIPRIIYSLNSGLHYIESHLHGTILDAGIGSRILASQLGLFLDNSSITVKLPSTLLNELVFLYKKSQELNEAIVTNAADNSDYSESLLADILPIINSSHLWDSPKLGAWIHSQDGFNNDFIPQTLTTRDDFNGSLSDSCIGQLFRDCTISPECADYSFGTVHNNYGLTHVIIYMLIAEKVSCTQNEAYMSNFKLYNSQGKDSSWDKFKENLCYDVWNYANSIAQAHFKEEFRDLFLEEITMCSQAGYKEFLNDEWLPSIMSWQNLNVDVVESKGFGCWLRKLYPTKSNNNYVNDDDDDDDDDTSKDERGGRYKRKDMIFTAELNGRKERQACSIHFTALGISSLAMYLRLILETCFL